MMVMDWKDMAGGNLKELTGINPLKVLLCPYCQRNQGFDETDLNDYKSPEGMVTIHVLHCQNCVNKLLYTVERNGLGSSGRYRYVVYPSRPDVEPPHESWPGNIGSYITEARRSLTTGNWTSAAIMARTILQAAVREFDPKGANLEQEIDYLAKERIITDAMLDWAHHIRLVGNEVVHPDPTQPPPTEQEARDLLKFTEAFLLYVYTIPWDMQLQKDRMQIKPKS